MDPSRAKRTKNPCAASTYTKFHRDNRPAKPDQRNTAQSRLPEVKPIFESKCKWQISSLLSEKAVRQSMQLHKKIDPTESSLRLLPPEAWQFGHLSLSQAPEVDTVGGNEALITETSRWMSKASIKTVWGSFVQTLVQRLGNNLRENPTMIIGTERFLLHSVTIKCLYVYALEVSRFVNKSSTTFVVVRSQEARGRNETTLIYLY